MNKGQLKEFEQIMKKLSNISSQNAMIHASFMNFSHLLLNIRDSLVDEIGLFNTLSHMECYNKSENEDGKEKGNFNLRFKALMELLDKMDIEADEALDLVFHAYFSMLKSLAYPNKKLLIE